MTTSHLRKLYIRIISAQSPDRSRRPELDNTHKPDHDAEGNELVFVERCGREGRRRKRTSSTGSRRGARG
eukprot:265400-Heterocapsa_arctica.AAC.1